MKEKTSKSKKGIVYSAKVALTALTAAYCVGCGTMNYDIKPYAGISGNSSEGLEGKMGIVIGGQDSKKESTGMTVWNTIRGPFYVYRYSDGKWFPEWREHPIRTSVMTAVYAGTAYAISQFESSGGSSSQAPADNTTTTTQPTSSKPEPTPNPYEEEDDDRDDGGSSSGDSSSGDGGGTTTGGGSW